MTNTIPTIEQARAICRRAIAAENKRGGGEILPDDYLTVANDFAIDNNNSRIVLVPTIADNTATAIRVCRLWAKRIKDVNEYNLPITVKCRVKGSPPRYLNAYNKCLI